MGNLTFTTNDDGHSGKCRKTVGLSLPFIGKNAKKHC